MQALLDTILSRLGAALRTDRAPENDPDAEGAFLAEGAQAAADAAQDEGAARWPPLLGTTPAMPFAHAVEGEAVDAEDALDAMSSGAAEKDTACPEPTRGETCDPAHKPTLEIAPSSSHLQHFLATNSEEGQQLLHATESSGHAGITGSASRERAAKRLPETPTDSAATLPDGSIGLSLTVTASTASNTSPIPKELHPSGSTGQPRKPPVTTEVTITADQPEQAAADREDRLPISESVAEAPGTYAAPKTERTQRAPDQTRPQDTSPRLWAPMPSIEDGKTARYPDTRGIASQAESQLAPPQSFSRGDAAPLAELPREVSPTAELPPNSSTPPQKLQGTEARRPSETAARDAAPDQLAAPVAAPSLSQQTDEDTGVLIGTPLHQQPFAASSATERVSLPQPGAKASAAGVNSARTELAEVKPVAGHEDDGRTDQTAGVKWPVAEMPQPSEAGHPAMSKAPERKSTITREVDAPTKGEPDSVEQHSRENRSKVQALTGLGAPTREVGVTAAVTASPLPSLETPPVARRLEGMNGGVEIPDSAQISFAIGHDRTTATSAAGERASLSMSQTAIPSHWPGAQIATKVSTGKDHVIDLELSPRELGHLRLSLLPTQDGVTVSIVADRTETLDLLRRHCDLLAKDFRAAGMTDVSFFFSQQQHSPGTQRGSESRRESEEQAAFAVASPAITASGLTAPSGALDLRL